MPSARQVERSSSSGSRLQQEVHTQVNREMDGCNRLLFVSWPVELRHAHASEADGRDGERTVTQFPITHSDPLLESVQIGPTKLRISSRAGLTQPFPDRGCREQE